LKNIIGHIQWSITHSNTSDIVDIKTKSHCISWKLWDWSSTISTNDQISNWKNIDTSCHLWSWIITKWWLLVVQFSYH
jgi:hypothetical protein